MAKKKNIKKILYSTIYFLEQAHRMRGVLGRGVAAYTPARY